jgi:flagellar assembly protein FliH
MTGATRIIRGDAALEASRWDAPAVDASAAAELKGAAGRSAHLLTARQLDELQRQVHKEAHDRGYAQGLAEGRAELGKRAARLEGLIEALGFPFHDLDQAVAEELAELAIALASHLVRREIAAHAAELAQTVRDCIETLPIAARDVTVHMHPDDVALVSGELGDNPERAWRLEPDRNLARGDLRVQSPTSQIDGRLETRMREIISAALIDAGEPGMPA